MSTDRVYPTQQIQGGSGEMFDQIAHRYDLLNRINSFGTDQRWRKKTVAALQLGARSRVLDLATGTADLALKIAAQKPDCSVVGVDPSEQMLKFARRKIEEKGFGERIELCVGDAQALPFEAASFDAISMAFGIRNVPDRERALAEMRRVARPGASLAILELSEPRTGLLGALARFHVHRMVPLVGAMLSGSREYRYLERSIKAFPPAPEFEQAIQRAGFSNVRSQALTWGVCHLYTGTVAPS